MNKALNSQKIRVFVHLARDKDVEAWRAARAAGRLVGVNDETPYGYGRADSMGCEVRFSRSAPEAMPVRLIRLALRAWLGFDLVHALRQQAGLLWADVVWTHTESQYLAVAAASRLWRTHIPLIGQSVWLMDHWASWGPIRRAFVRRLVERVDLLTFHSPLNREAAEACFPASRIELVPFGIPAEQPTEPRRRGGAPIRILALGNDRHRDWPTLLAAVCGEPGLSLLILSGSVTPGLAAGAPNVEIRNAVSQDDLIQAFAAATIVCVPLRPNLHASGITAIQETVLAGVPVVATDTGGLDSYFARDEVNYVPPGDSAALRAALLALGSDPDGALAQARRAQARMRSGVPGAEAYIRRHVELSREILSRDETRSAGARPQPRPDRRPAAAGAG